ncbi:MAG: YggS family pyridoxal phosphate-dependent enzyme [Bacteroidota bacterium]
MTIAESLLRLQLSIPEHVRIVAVSKTKPVSAIVEAYAAGQRLFGENKAQELVAKQAQLPADIEWHFIGHLQTNKVRYIAPFISLIHSIDSLSLLREVNREAMKNNRVIECLLQLYIATEETKFGLTLEETRNLLGDGAIPELKNVRITGVMGMSSFTSDKALVRREFATLRGWFKLIKEQYFFQAPEFRELSMGMSDDYRIAVEEGSTMIRIGTTLFGNR